MMLTAARGGQVGECEASCNKPTFSSSSVSGGPVGGSFAGPVWRSKNRFSTAP